ncbi:MAG: hypothetical protein NVV74_13345 [Magnetospirillum sp.]|nr:hypothetical protein [Magnetospirillum sp.]
MSLITQYISTLQQGILSYGKVNAKVRPPADEGDTGEGGEKNARPSSANVAKDELDPHAPRGSHLDILA